jgi:hypothetical protein
MPAHIPRIGAHNRDGPCVTWAPTLVPLALTSLVLDLFLPSLSLSTSLAPTRTQEISVRLTNKANFQSHSTAIMSMSCVLKDDCITFNGDLKISFRRTTRVPDNEELHQLPPDLGAFPLKAVSQYSTKLNPAMVLKGGVFFPMHRKCSPKCANVIPS